MILFIDLLYLVDHFDIKNSQNLPYIQNLPDLAYL